jgi:hypothetical protein
MVKIINGKQRIVSMRNIGDIEVFSDIGESAIDKESVPVIGEWKDQLLHGETNSGGPPSRAQLMWGGHVNRLWGTDAQLHGIRLPNLNEVGENADTTRRRKKVLITDSTEGNI